MSTFAVTLPGVPARHRDDAARKLAQTAYLYWAQGEKADAMFFKVGAEAVRVADRARDVVEAIAATLPGDGVVEARTGGLDRADRCRVSLVLRNAVASAAAVTAMDWPEHVASVLDSLRSAWDHRHPDVPVADRDLSEVLTRAAQRVSAERERERRRQHEAAVEANVRRRKREDAARAAALAARAGLAAGDGGAG